MLYYYLSGIMFLFISFNMFLFSLYMMYFDIIYFFEWMIININSVYMNMFMYMDWMSLMFIFTVMMISSMIMLYSSEYMNHDNYVNRFFFLVFMFIISMILMIISPNMVSILLGWDGLGLISYCLVIYYNNYSSYNSGMLTVLMNRVGDVMIIISIGLMFSYGSWNFLNYNEMNYLILFLVVIACFTKSAQVPFSSWLPAAMAAPTPVSSLVHSSTLVTAGVYLLIRFNYMIYKNFLLMNFIMMFGLITMLLAGMSANYEFDLKKIIAFSTLSQLGLMMMIYSMNNYVLTFFHLIIHAMFKSLMFMCSGIMIHMMLNFQDIRFMSSLKKFLPLTMVMFFISNLSLCGMPFLSGFYSKDQILEYMFIYKYSNFMTFYLLLATMLTVCYSFRLFYYLMETKYNFLSIFKIYDIKMMNFPMLLLMVMSMMFGLLMNWLMFNNVEYMFLYKLEKTLILILCFLSLNIVNINMNLFFNYKGKKYYLKYFLKNMWFLLNFNKMYIILPLNLGKFYNLIFDKGWSEYFLKKFLLLKVYNLNFINYMMMNYLMMMFLLIMYMFIFILLY